MAKRRSSSSFTSSFKSVPSDPFRRHPSELPPKTTLMALFLLTLGIIFCTVGAYTFLYQTLSEAVPFWTVGGICFLPGAYASFVIFKTWSGDREYRYEMIPSYDDY